MNTAVYKEYINAVMANVTPLSLRRRCLPSSPRAHKTFAEVGFLRIGKGIAMRAMISTS
jgi:hypothetical protein